MHAFRLDEDPNARNLDLAEQVDQLSVRLGRDAPGAPIGDAAGLVDRGKVDPRGQIGRLEREANPQRRKDATPNVTPDWIVAEKREMSRAAPRRDPRRDGDAQPAD